MKRICASKAMKGQLLIGSLFFLTSCSSVLLHRDQSVDSALKDGAVPRSGGMVPREQYDEVVRKYQELLNQSKNIKGEEAPASVTLSLDEQKKPEMAQETHIDPSELVNRIDKSLPDLAKSSAVKNEEMPHAPTSSGVEVVNNTDEIDGQITRLREAQGLVKANKFDQALAILKDLEESKEKQIAVRAKMMLGDSLFNQGEYDLASQVYEEIVGKYAFSGLVLKALSKLVVCSEKLKQADKQAKYYSLLHDFFEAG